MRIELLVDLKPTKGEKEPLQEMNPISLDYDIANK